MSAYTSDIAETDDTPFTTASGARTEHGVIACPRKYDFGTQVKIKGEIYTCEDRMNIRYDGEHFDIWMEHKTDAYNWGRRLIEVKIIK